MQRGAVVWITGLPSSGKSTFGARLSQRLMVLGVPTCVLDGDRVRECLVPTPGYEADERAMFYDTLARLAALLAAQGLVVLVPATANLRSFRENARRRAPHFMEVYLNTPREECEARDSKGLYRKSRGTVANEVPGAGAVYEPPLQPEIEAKGGEDVDAMTDVINALGRI